MNAQEISALIFRSIGPAMTLAAAGASILERINAGKLTPIEAVAEWQKSQDDWRRGADAWDAAGKER